MWRVTLPKRELNRMENKSRLHNPNLTTKYYKIKLFDENHPKTRLFLCSIHRWRLYVIRHGYLDNLHHYVFHNLVAHLYIVIQIVRVGIPPTLQSPNRCGCGRTLLANTSLPLCSVARRTCQGWWRGRYMYIHTPHPTAGR
jgi:hypothetical protein